ncbi:hypothetical protein [Halobaculum lipolyticum]|uniref:DNA replication factor GINS n=1 Tax=Halobaculum lipolyticum TaxID=3032001 RepID=A0ABD5W6H8_9EURY|nr:hypothetical protein [Halobaculum sp. DT31]
MDLDELRSVQSKERRKDSLQHLRDSFYEDVAAYLAERKRRRDERANSVDNPFSDKEVRKLSDEIETAEEVVESLYQRRVGKVVKLSSFAAAGAPTDTEGMTIQEAELFEDLVVRIEQNKDRVLDVLENGADVDIDVRPEADGTASAEPVAANTTNAADADAAAGAEAGADTGDRTGDAPSPPPDAPPDAPPDGGDGGVLTDAMGGGASDAGDDGAADEGARTGTSADTARATPPSGGEEPGGDAEPGEFVPGSEPDRAGGDPDDATDGDTAGRRTVVITRDVGSILGVDDVEYDLAAEDVVSLPAENAEPLVERDAAEPIE